MASKPHFLIRLFQKLEKQSTAGKRTARVRHEYPFFILLMVVVGLTWCTHYNLWTRESWATPVNYLSDTTSDMAFSGEALWGMAATKLMASGEIPPILPKCPISLGAPFGANWNDVPTIAEGINASWTLLARGFGLFTGSNLTLLFAHLLAAGTFYLVCRYLRYDQWLSFAGAVLFSLSRYAFWRGLSYLPLTFYWHLPLGFLVLRWCMQGERLLAQRNKLFFSAAVAVLHGIQSPYYSAIFLQFLCGTAALSGIRWRHWRAAVPSALIGAVLLTTVVVMNLDTFFNRIMNGPNPAAVTADYRDVEFWALKPVELFVPFSHSIPYVETWAKKAYYQGAMFLGERGSAYLGLIGTLSLALVVWSAIRGVVRGKSIPSHFWGISWVFAYSIVGGVTGLVGLGNVFMLRATNRYSIVIFAIALLFFVKQLTVFSRRWNIGTVIFLSVVLIVVGVIDQVPPYRSTQGKAGLEMVRQDRELMSTLESRLRPRAMIFQLPVFHLAEGFEVGKAGSYEPFRPYLHSQQLKFSFGNVTGRYHGRWQSEAEQLEPSALVKLLENYGFSAVLITRRDYSDRAAALQESLRAAGAGRILARSRDFLAVALNPARRPTLPPEFGPGWYGIDRSFSGNRRWSSGDATVVLHNPDREQRPARIRFRLVAVDEREVEISAGDRILYRAVIDPTEDPPTVAFMLRLAPGATELHFATNRPAEPSFRQVDGRRAFQLLDFQLLD